MPSTNDSQQHPLDRARVDAAFRFPELKKILKQLTPKAKKIWPKEKVFSELTVKDHKHYFKKLLKFTVSPEEKKAACELIKSLGGTLNSPPLRKMVVSKQMKLADSSS